MQVAYENLFRLGLAHSTEVWDGESLVGGVYGVAVGGVFFAESMFSHASQASKVALLFLCRHLDVWGFTLLDCQLSNPHLLSLGAMDISRQSFTELVMEHRDDPGRLGRWTPCISAQELHEF